MTKVWSRPLRTQTKFTESAIAMVLLIMMTSVSCAPLQVKEAILTPGTPDSPLTAQPTGANDPDSITIAVKYIALRNTKDDPPSPNQEAVEQLLRNVSGTWAQCKIRFTLQEYDAPIARDHDLDFTPANLSDLDAMRAEFDEQKYALLVKTGTWNRSGTLGKDGSNGFSTMPDAAFGGVVFESKVATSTLLLAHELGHLIGGLDHTTSPTNLMNHYVSAETTTLTPDQCAGARAAIEHYHPEWIR